MGGEGRANRISQYKKTAPIFEKPEVISPTSLRQDLIEGEDEAYSPRLKVGGTEAELK